MALGKRIARLTKNPNEKRGVLVGVVEAQKLCSIKRRSPMILRPRLPCSGWKQPLVRVARAGLISLPRCGRRRTIDTTPDAYTPSFHCSLRSNHSSQFYLWSWRCSNVTFKLRDSSCDLFDNLSITRDIFVKSVTNAFWKKHKFERGDENESGSRSTSHDNGSDQTGKIKKYLSSCEYLKASQSPTNYIRDIHSD